MTRQQYREFITDKGFMATNMAINPILSECDPSLAMTGAQIFMAAMQGKPIPCSGVQYYYSGVKADDLGSSDVAFPDKFDVAMELKSSEKEIKQKYDQVKNKEKKV